MSSARCWRAIDNHLRARANILAHMTIDYPRDTPGRREKSDFTREDRIIDSLSKNSKSKQETLEDRAVAARVSTRRTFRPSSERRSGVRPYLYKIFGQRATASRYLPSLIPNAREEISYAGESTACFRVEREERGARSRHAERSSVGKTWNDSSGIAANTCSGP